MGLSIAVGANCKARMYEDGLLKFRGNRFQRYIVWSDGVEFDPNAGYV